MSQIVNPSTLYEKTDLLGEGSYGSVYKALSKLDGKTVAVKIVPVESDSKALQKEINILRKCKDKRVVKYYGSYEDKPKNEIWIVMEYCGAGSVSDLMQICDITLSEDEISVVCKETLLGLKYLHENKFIHRDIKAGNILLTSEGHAKLADFGVSVQLVNTISKRRTVIGTPYWMAPEVLQETDYNSKADLWSLGITAIEMSTGAPPLANVHPMRAIFLIPNKPPPELPNNANFSSKFRDFVSLCCTKNPEKRPSADELLSHPFIRSAKSHLVLQELVLQCLPHIEEYRSNPPGDEEDEDNNTGTVKQTRSMKRGVDTANDTSDMSSVDAGTVVFTSGTIVVGGNDGDDDDGEPQWGDTMVNSDTMVLTDKNGDGGDDDENDVPAYMKRFISDSNNALADDHRSNKKGRDEDSKDQRNHKNGISSRDRNLSSTSSDYNTMRTIDNNTAEGAGVSTISTNDTFGFNQHRHQFDHADDISNSSTASGPLQIPEYFRTGTSPAIPPGASIFELRERLISLNRAYRKERDALDEFYAKRREVIRTMINEQEKENPNSTLERQLSSS